MAAAVYSPSTVKGPQMDTLLRLNFFQRSIKILHCFLPIAVSNRLKNESILNLLDSNYERNSVYLSQKGHNKSLA